MLYYYLVLICHFLITLFLYFGWISNNKKILQILFIMLIISLALYIIFRGCFITKWERKVSKSDFTVIDPVLNFLSIKIDRNSRFYITLYMYMLSLLITSIKLYVVNSQDT